jgi:hypothetical protein
LAIGEHDGVEVDNRGALLNNTADSTTSLANADPRTRTRKVEHGVLETPCKILVSLQFDGFPIWILALDSTLVKRVAIHGSSSENEFLGSMADEGFNQGLIESALKNMGPEKVEYTTLALPSSETLLLVSGSITFIKEWTPQVPNPTLVICNEHVRSKHMHGDRSFWWSCFHHETFGGVTHFQTMFGTNISDFEPCRTDLCRTIWHVLDYSLKPKWATVPALGKTPCTLSLNDRLHPCDLRKHVLYHTHYSGTG